MDVEKEDTNMSMEITNNYGNYITGYANAAKKTGSTESKNEEEKGVKTSTVELKTSTHGVTKTAQIKTGFSNVNDYSKYLQEKYSYMNTGKTSMSGIPTTVTVSSAFLKKCMNDPEKAKYLEENLEAIPDCAKKTLTSCLGTVTNQTWSIDANGNITATVSGTSDSDGKIDNFISTRNFSYHLPVHELNDKEPYYLGVFLVGAYQEILGDLHNLFGDTNAVHIKVKGNEYVIDKIIEGETVADVLEYVQFSPKKMARTVEVWVTTSVKKGIISAEEGREFLSNYRSGLYGYTYLE